MNQFLWTIGSANRFLVGFECIQFGFFTLLDKTTISAVVFKITLTSILGVFLDVDTIVTIGTELHFHYYYKRIYLLNQF
jgi:hypothetical protein